MCTLTPTKFFELEGTNGLVKRIASINFSEYEWYMKELTIQDCGIYLELRYFNIKIPKRKKENSKVVKKKKC